MKLSRSTKDSRLLVCQGQVVSLTIRQACQLVRLISGKERSEILAAKVATVAVLAGKRWKASRARSVPSSSSSSSNCQVARRMMAGVSSAIVLVTFRDIVAQVTIGSNKVAA